MVRWKEGGETMKKTWVSQARVNKKKVSFTPPYPLTYLIVRCKSNVGRYITETIFVCNRLNLFVLKVEWGEVSGKRPEWVGRVI